MVSPRPVSYGRHVLDSEGGVDVWARARPTKGLSRCMKAQPPYFPPDPPAVPEKGWGGNSASGSCVRRRQQSSSSGVCYLTKGCRPP